MSHNIKLSDDEIEKILQDYRLKKESEKEQLNNDEVLSEPPKKSVIDKLKEWLHQKEISVFPILFVILLCMSLGISLLIIVVLACLDLLINRPDQILLSFLYFIPFYGVYISDRLNMKLFHNLNFYNGKRDWKRNNFISVQGSFVLSFTINSVYASLRLFFRKEKAEGHICKLRLNNGMKLENIFYILTKDRLDALQTIYDAEMHYVCGSMVSRGIEFKNNIPLIVTFGKHSHVLKSIAPAEGYEYTEAQLAAIEKFNVLYP